MIKVKLFEEGDCEALETMVNQWFSEHPAIEIVTICQSECACWDGEDMLATTTISIFYLSPPP